MKRKIEKKIKNNVGTSVSPVKKTLVNDSSVSNFLDDYLSTPMVSPSPFSNESNASTFSSSDTDELFSSLETSPHFKGDKTSRNNKLKGTYTIFSVNTLPELIEELRKSTDKDTITLRFVVTPNNEISFAREGAPNSFIPAHFAMTGLVQTAALCKTAGNIKINKTNEVVFISHKSGDFQPSWPSLIHGLFALLACNVKFADEFQIEKYVTIYETLNVKLDRVTKEIDSKFTPEQKEQCREANSKLVNKTHVYPTIQHQVTEIGMNETYQAKQGEETPRKFTNKSNENSRLQSFANSRSSLFANYDVNKPTKTTEQKEQSKDTPRNFVNQNPRRQSNATVKSGLFADFDDSTKAPKKESGKICDITNLSPF
ncbi:MAG: hypothetical protein H0U73_09520 [Tatlockia sp.]|nr:hypothetical protein [Tatlockia sp.]